jgi:hypothetical protein
MTMHLSRWTNQKYTICINISIIYWNKTACPWGSRDCSSSSSFSHPLLPSHPHLNCNDSDNSPGNSNNQLVNSTSPYSSNNSCRTHDISNISTQLPRPHMANARCNCKRQPQWIQQWPRLAGTARSAADAPLLVFSIIFHSLIFECFGFFLTV